MVVTDPFGSLMVDILRRIEPSQWIMAKLVIDTAKGLAYLHGNGILHRDIKPDNVPVFSLDEVLEANAKLPEFGSSRNINTLMTNMTFTNGV